MTDNTNNHKHKSSSQSRKVWDVFRGKLYTKGDNSARSTDATSRGVNTKFLYLNSDNSSRTPENSQLTDLLISREDINNARQILKDAELLTKLALTRVSEHEEDKNLKELRKQTKKIAKWIGKVSNLNKYGLWQIKEMVSNCKSILETETAYSEFNKKKRLNAFNELYKTFEERIDHLENMLNDAQRSQPPVEKTPQQLIEEARRKVGEDPDSSTLEKIIAEIITSKMIPIVDKSVERIYDRNDVFLNEHHFETANSYKIARAAYDDKLKAINDNSENNIQLEQTRIAIRKEKIVQYINAADKVLKVLKELEEFVTSIPPYRSEE